MSSVRMCDKCGDVFSERADGWSTFTGSTRRKNTETGKFETISDTLDSCPDCTELMTGAPPQRPAAQVGHGVQGHYEPEPKAISGTVEPAA